MTKKEAGSIGGKSTVKKYGVEYMRSIGKRGALIFYQRYELTPVNLNQFAIVERATGKIKAVR